MDDLTLPNLTVQQLEYLVAAAGSPTTAEAVMARAAASARIFATHDGSRGRAESVDAVLLSRVLLKRLG